MSSVSPPSRRQRVVGAASWRCDEGPSSSTEAYVTRDRGRVVGLLTLPSRPWCRQPSVAEVRAPRRPPSCPTVDTSSSRVARRTPARLPNVVSSVLRRRGPMPGTPSSSDRRSRMLRALRWNVTAKRCASSRIRCSSSSAGSFAASAIGSGVIAREDQLLLLREADRDQVGEAERLERLVGRRELALAAVDDDQVGKRAAVLEQLAVAPRDDLPHRGEVVEERGVRLQGSEPCPTRRPVTRNASGRDAELPVLALRSSGRLRRRPSTPRSRCPESSRCRSTRCAAAAPAGAAPTRSVSSAS